MDTTTRVQILDKIACISYSPNTIGEGMNATIPKSSYGMATGLGEEKLLIQTY